MEDKRTESPPDLAATQAVLEARVAQFQRTGDAHLVLEEALVLQTLQAAQFSAAQGGLDTDFVAAVGWFFWCRHVAGQDPWDLEQARTWFQMLEVIDYSRLPAQLRLSPAREIGEHEKPVNLLEQAQTRLRTAIVEEDHNGANEALALAFAGLQRSPRGHRDRAFVLTSLAVLLADAARFTGDIMWMDSAITKLSTVVDEVQATGDNPGIAVAHFGSIYYQRYEMSLRKTDLDKAIHFHTMALSLPLEYDFGYETAFQLSVEHLERYRQAGEVSDLQASVERAEQALIPEGLTASDVTSRRVILAEARAELFRAGENDEDLHAAMAQFAKVREISDPEQLSHWTAAVNLASLQAAAHNLWSDNRYLDLAIANFQYGLSSGSLLDRPAFAGSAFALAKLLARRYWSGNEATDLDSALATIDKIQLELLDQEASALAASLRASLLEDRWRAEGNLDDLSLAIDTLRGLSARHGVLAGRNAVLLISLLANRLNVNGAGSDINEVIAESAEIVNMTMGKSPSNDKYVGQLAELLYVLHWRRFRLTGTQWDLDRAIDNADKALSNAESDEVRVRNQTNLAFAHFERHKRTGEGFETGVRLLLTAAETSADMRSVSLARLSMMMHERFEETFDEGDLERSFEYATQAVAAANNGENLADSQSVLGHALWRKAERSGDPELASQAFNAFEQASQHPSRSGIVDQTSDLNGMCLALQSLAELADDPDAAGRAVESGRRAVALSGQDNFASGDDATRHTWLLNNLANALEKRASITGSPHDNGEAVEILRVALHTARDARQKAAICGNLGRHLRSRAAIHHSHADIAESLAFARQAVALSDLQDINRTDYLLNLMISIGDSWEQIPGHAALAEGRAAAQELFAHAHLPDNLRSFVHDQLSRLLFLAGQTDRTIIEEAIEQGRLAVTEAPEGRRWVQAASGLVEALYHQYKASGEVGYLEEATVVGTIALGHSGPNDPNYWANHATLVRILIERGFESRDGGNLELAETILRTAAGNSAGPPRSRADAAARLGHLASAKGDWLTACAGYMSSVRLLPLAAWRGLNRNDRGLALAEFQGVARDAAACLIQLGRDSEALVILDQGLGILWGHPLGYQTDLKLLAAKHPQIAARAQELLIALDSTDDNRLRTHISSGSAPLGRDKSGPEFARFTSAATIDRDL